MARDLTAGIIVIGAAAAGCRRLAPQASSHA
jgi:hypothetical protein